MKQEGADGNFDSAQSPRFRQETDFSTPKVFHSLENKPGAEQEDLLMSGVEDQDGNPFTFKEGGGVGG